MIGTTARILVGVIIGVAVCVALVVALCVDLFATETRPSMLRARSNVRLMDRNLPESSVSVTNAAGAWRPARPRLRSLSEAHT